VSVLGRDPVAAFVLPATEAPGHRHDVGVAELLQRLGGERGTGAACAVDDDRGVVVRDLVLDLALEVAAGDEDRTGDHALLELVELAHVQEGGRADARLGIGRGDLLDLRLRLLQQVAKTRHTKLPIPDCRMPGPPVITPEQLEKRNLPGVLTG